MKIIFVFVENHLTIQEVKISCKISSGLNINTPCDLWAGLDWVGPLEIGQIFPALCTSRSGADWTIFAEKKGLGSLNDVTEIEIGLVGT